MEKGQQWEMDLYERAVALMGEETVYIHVINRMAMLCRAMVDCMDGKKNRSEKCMKRVAERRALGFPHYVIWEHPDLDAFDAREL